MKIKVIANNPKDIQGGIEHLIGKEFDTVQYNKYWDRDIVKEMKELEEVGILEYKQNYPTILNKNEYEVIG